VQQLLIASGETSLELPGEMSAISLSNRINQLADSVVAQSPEIVIAGTLRGYDYDAAFPVLVLNLFNPPALLA
jgi:hypothetical protein